ncbi:hypothetical protein AAC387_Pa09g0542 [Persea americana]
MILLHDVFGAVLELHGSSVLHLDGLLPGFSDLTDSEFFGNILENFRLTYYILTVQFGYIVLTASAGIMDREEARRKNVGGKVLGFFY